MIRLTLPPCIRRKLFLLFGLAGIVGASASSGQLLSELPLDAEARTDETPAMAVVPTVWSGGHVEGYLPPAHFVARLQDVEHPRQELVFPAGVWFEPPPGWYHVWAEGEWWVSPSPMKLSYSGSKDVLLRPDMVPGGRVRLSATVDGGQEFVLLSANHQYRGENPPFEMKRVRPVDAVGDGILIAEGPALAGLWDPAGNRFVALSRPFRVEHRATVAAPLEAPTSTAHLLVELRRNHQVEQKRGRGLLQPRLRVAGRERPPDLLVPTAICTYAVWYDLPAGPAILTATSPFTALVPEPVDLTSGSIEYRQLQMAPLRILDVTVDLPSPLDSKELTLTVRGLPQGLTIAEANLAARTSGHRFEKLVPLIVEVELTTPLGSFRDRVDLRESEVSQLTIAPKLLNLWGRVELDDQGHAGTVTLRTISGEEVAVETKEDGSYEVTVVAPVRSVEVRLSDSEVPPWVDFFSPPIEHDRELNFHLLDVENKVEVVDSLTGDPLPRARVTVRNSYEQHDEALDRTVEKVVMQQQNTDEKGVALLPPFRKGRVEVKASIEGYLPLAEPVRRQVADPSEDTSLRISLEPLGDTVEVSLRMSDGSPASSGEVMLVGGLPGQSALFTGRADTEGTVRVPRLDSASLVLVRHPNAASDVRSWPPERHDATFDWILPASVPTPLSVEVRAPGGETAGRQAELVLWLKGYRLLGPALAWLTRSRPYTDQSGYWVGEALPPAPLVVLAVSPGLRNAAAAGELDSLAIEVPFPWPSSPVVIEAVR